MAVTVGSDRNQHRSLKEAASWLGVSPHTLRTWAIYQRRLPFFRLGRRILFAQRDLEEFTLRHRVEAREVPR